MKWLGILIFCVASSFLYALNVNQLNGSANLTYVDFSIPGPVLPVELLRSYNSITAVNETSGWNGAFGWGWTTLSESILTVTGDRKILLRDGQSGNTLTFAREKEDPKIQERFIQEIKAAYFKEKSGRAFSPSEISTKTLPEAFLSRLQSDPQFRAEMAVKYRLKAEIPKGEVLVSSEYGYQSITFRSGEWVREYEGITQAFDRDGRIVRQIDKNGFTLSFVYGPALGAADGEKRLIRLESNDKSVSLKFTWKKDRISEVIDNRSLRATYSYDSLGNLTRVSDSTGQQFGYRYENRRLPHLITHVDYLSESQSKRAFREIRYDENGLVSFYRDKDGSEVQYSYGKSPSDPQNNFWTKFVKTLPDGRKEEQYDDFTIKTEGLGIRYLYRQETRKNGKAKVTLYTPCCGKPSKIIENGAETNFTYYPNGLLKEKTSAGDSIRLEYDPRFKKISRAIQNGITSDFRYDSKGNLVSASNSRKEEVLIDYDKFGRITSLRSPKGGKIQFVYGNIGKPVLITDRNEGTVRLTYDSNGRISKAETVRTLGRSPTGRRPQEIIRSVTREFKRLLNIIRPAGVQVPMG